MARARNIKPGFFRNADLIEMAPLVRILFAGLWTIADREGRLQDRPKQIKMDVLPGDDLDVDSALNELQKAGFIHRYEACGKRVIAILNFGKHQNPHCKEPASELPAPEEHSASTVQAQCKHGAGTEVAGLIPDSGFLIPESKPCPSSASADGRGTAKEESPIREPSGFAEFWSAYPKKVGKAEARKAFAKARINGHLPDVLKAISEQAASEQWRKEGGQFIPNPATWIRQGRWEDEGLTTAKPAARDWL